MCGKPANFTAMDKDGLIFLCRDCAKQYKDASPIITRYTCEGK
jgi:hypothetical protein